MPVSEETYRRVALENPEGWWELHCGRLVRKPAMTIEHGWVARTLAILLHEQLGRADYEVVINAGRVYRSPRWYFIPDVFVVPMDRVRQLRAQPDALEVYEEPLPLVVEVWSPSTGDYDVGEKLSEYQRGGDLEIWRIHPYEQTLTAWRQQPDGTYSQTVYRGGTVQPAALPNVTINLDALFD